MTAFAKFLSRNTVVAVTSLPLVHTTRSYNIGEIKDTQEISVTPCPMFEGEDLVYLFVGRPAYKRPPSSSEASYWELPCCFIFNFDSAFDVKRIFPFDSGAFRKGLYPDYISFMDWEKFEASVPDAPERIIGAFFGSSRRYFDLRPKDEEAFESEFQLGPIDAEVKALRRLAADGTPGSFDDRRFTIEIQCSESISLKRNPPIAVILPSIYLRDEKVRNRIVKEWRAEPITYEIYSLSHDRYDAIIYSAVEDFYKGRGFL